MVQILLLLSCYFDVKESRIPNWLILTGLTGGLLFAVVHPERKLSEAVVGAMASLVVGFLCWLLKAVRGGDAKLFCALGAYLGWEMALNCFSYALLVAGAVGLPLVVVKFFTKKTGHTEVPFALMLTVGTFLAKQFGFLWELI